MNFNINGHNVFIIVAVTFLASLIFIYISKQIAQYIGAMDIPNERSAHKKPTPLLGGVGIFFSFLLGYMIFGEENTLMLSVLMASFLVLLLGVFDDIKPIPARYKIIVHVLVAAIVVFYGGLELTHIELFSFKMDFYWASPYITMLIIISIINAINLIDGLDGLCAGVSSIYFLTIGIIALMLNKLGGLDIILSFIMLGATLGYLVYNFPPAKIFQGDAGSTFLGLMISVIMLLGFKTVTLTSLVVPLVLLALPITDTLFAIIRRIVNKKPIGEADKEHIHHQLLKRLSTKKTVIIIYSINIIFSIVTIFYASGKKEEMIFFYIILVFILLFLIFKTNVIFDRTKNKKNRLIDKK